MYFLGLWSEITNAMVGALRSFLLSLCETVYGLIIFCFNVFEKIGTARLLDSDTVNMLYEKVGLILGIYMIFRLTFVTIQYVLDPDAMTDKSKGAGKLITKVIIVIALLGTTPFIFNLAYKLQSTIVEEKIIGKVILSSNGDVSNFGGELSWYLFSAFYQPTEIFYYEQLSSGTQASSNKCIELDVGLIENDMIKNGTLRYAYNCITDTFEYKTAEGIERMDYVIKFDGILALVVGIGALWIIVMYTISVGFRLIQLAFLELIAPLPIMMYLEPKDDGPFQKWIKLCVSCYLDYFIRTTIIYFIVFLVKKIMDMDTSYFFTQLGDITDNEYRYIVIIIIFGLLMFAKKLPDLLKEVLPGGGNSFSDFGFSFKKRADNMLGGSYINKGYDKLKGFAGNTAKAIGLMPINGVKRAITGIDSGIHGKGFWNGFWKNPGKMGQWINKQRETFTPEGYKAYQERREGRENVSAIDDKWTSGVSRIKKLIKAGHFTGKSGGNSWTDAFDGVTTDNYKLFFRHSEFINSLMAVDTESNREKELRQAKSLADMGSASVTANGITYLKTGGAPGCTFDDLIKELEKSQKALKGLEEIHTEISKQYQDDARVEREIKFVKYNEVNPAEPTKTYASEGID